MSREPFAPGQVFRHPYPFVRTDYETPEGDTVKSWKPGCEYEQWGPEGEYTEAVADGMGEQCLTVVSVHKPGRYPTRVFYTVRWQDPDGKEFGKTRLHIATADKFRRLTQGYRFPVDRIRDTARARDGSAA